MIDGPKPLPRDALAAHRAAVLAIADSYGITNLRVFGSVARGEDTPGSDLDLLVTVPTDMGLLALSSFALDLEDLLGVKVDVVTDRGASPEHRIRRTAIPL